MNNSSTQIKFGAMVSYFAIFVNIVSGLIYTPWMIREIGQNNYGIYTLAISLISIFLVDFGMSEAVSKYLSKYNANNDQESVNNFLGIVYKLYVLIDGIILTALVIAFFLVDSIYAELTVAELSGFKTVYIIAATFSIVSFPFITLNGIFSSYEKFIQLKICDLFNKLLSILLITASILLDYGVVALVMANAISGLLIIGIKIIILKHITPIKINVKFKSKLMLKSIATFSIWSTITSISERFIFNITPTVLGAMSGSISIALFGVASTLEGYVFTFANAINGMFMPRVTRMLENENSKENILQLMIKIGRIQLAIIGLIEVGFISIGREFILLWVGKDYLVTYYCTVVLTLPSLISLTQEIANITVVALNKVRIKSYVYMSTALLNIVLCLGFSYFWGALGAALAIFCSYSIRYLAMNIIYYRSLNINIFYFFKECHLKILFPLLFTLLIGIGMYYLYPACSWTIFIVKGFILVLFYLVVMWLTYFNEYERDLILGLVQFVTIKLKSKKVR